MSKKFIYAAIAAIMLTAAPAYAQTTQKSEQNKARQEKMVKKDRKMDKLARAECRQLSDTCLSRAECTPRECEFEGLDLTDTQKSQLRALKDNQRKQMKARKDSAKEARQEAKAKIKADRKAMKEQRENERRAYLKEVKKILGNDKYVMFLENQYVQEAGRPVPVKEKQFSGRKVHRPNNEMKLRSDRKEMKGKR